MQEIELKLLVEPEGAGSVWQRAIDAGLATAAPPVRRLRSIYFDTPDQALRKAGIALRLRQDGSRWLQTVKAKPRRKGALRQVVEMECELPDTTLDLDCIADRKLRGKIRKIAADARLDPVCETEIGRAEAPVETVEGARALLAADEGRIIAGDRVAQFAEVEIELQAGPPASLFELARLLFPEGGARLSTLSKAERGYMLAACGRIEPPPEPRNAITPVLHASQTVTQAARAIIAECLDQITANIRAVAGSSNPEGPHQLRIGLRRLRSALSLFSEVLPADQAKGLADRARKLGREVGHLRDLDVVATDIVEPEAEAHADHEDLANLMDCVCARAENVRTGLRSLLAGPETFAFLLDICKLLAALDEDAEAPVPDVARPTIKTFANRVLKKRWMKTRKHARSIDRLNARQRHELRKDLKKLRYAVEFFSPLYRDKKVVPFVSQLKALQDLFGEVNDAAMVATRLKDRAFSDVKRPGIHHAIGWVIGRKALASNKVWAHARKRWKALKRTSVFWSEKK